MGGGEEGKVGVVCLKDSECHSESCRMLTAFSHYSSRVDKQQYDEGLKTFSVGDRHTQFSSCLSSVVFP